MYKKKVIALIALLMLGLTYMYILNPPEPERCAICTSLKRHAPCLLNLSTGEIRELELYEPHPYQVGEIADQQNSSIFTFIRFGDVQGTKTTSPWEISIKIPQKGDRIQRKYYCSNCRKMFSANKRGYVLLDLYNPSDPVMLPIFDGAEYSIRCYSLSIQKDKESRHYEATIVGTLSSKQQ